MKPSVRQEVSENKLESLGFIRQKPESGRCVFVRIVNGQKVATVTLDEAGYILDAEGVATDEKGIFIWLRRINRVKHGKTVVFNA